MVAFQLFLPSAVNIHSEAKFLSLGRIAHCLLCLPMIKKMRRRMKEKKECEEQKKVEVKK